MAHQNSGPRNYVHKTFHEQVVEGIRAGAARDRERVAELEQRIAYAMKTANGMWEQWGTRAESVCETNRTLPIPPLYRIACTEPPVRIACRRAARSVTWKRPSDQALESRRSEWTSAQKKESRCSIRNSQLYASDSRVPRFRSMMPRKWSVWRRNVSRLRSLQPFFSDQSEHRVVVDRLSGKS